MPDRVLKFGVRSRRGYIPGKVEKENQDSALSMRDLGSVKNQWVFGVFDGHGANGHHASEHVKKKLPINIHKADTHQRGKCECVDCANHLSNTF